jgi:hypothetical protein
MTFVNGYTAPIPSFTQQAPVSSAGSPTNPSSFYSSPTPPTLQATAPGSPTAPKAPSGSSGIYVGIATIGAILVSGTQFAPIAAGLLGVALIFQLQGIISGGGTSTA